MATGSSFAALMQRVEAGDEQAAAVVYERFVHRLLGLARGRLHGRLQGKLSADDVVQSVFRTFFRRAAVQQFDLEGEDALWALLAEITLRKCGRWNRYFSARKRGGHQEVKELGGLPPDQEPADPREPSPEDAAILLDLLEQVLRGLDARGRRIGEMRLQGYAVAEIAGEIGCTEVTVYRKLALLKQRLRQLCPDHQD